MTLPKDTICPQEKH